MWTEDRQGVNYDRYRLSVLVLTPTVPTPKDTSLPLFLTRVQDFDPNSGNVYVESPSRHLTAPRH